MPFALLLALSAIAGATLLTYLYERGALIWARLCAGVVVGFALLGLLGFILASLLGMNPLSLALAGALAASPLLLLLRPGVREGLKADAAEGLRDLSRPGRGLAPALLFYLVAAALFWLLCDRAMYENARGVFTGVDTNIGDLPFHLAVITGFAHGENFPPQHPEFAGARLTYPFVVDFVTAMFVRAGASLSGAMFWQNYAMMMALVGLLHHWAWRLTRERAAALVTPALVLLSGGFGWLAFVKEAASGGRGVFGMLVALEHDYTIMRHIGYAWGNAVTALLVPQRGILLGVALALVVWTLWWENWGAGEEAEEDGGRRQHEEIGGGKRSKKKLSKRAEAEARLKENQAEAHSVFPARGPRPTAPMIAAGLVAGLLPLVHAHSFVVLMTMGGCLALLQAAFVWFGGPEAETEGETRGGRVWRVWRPWVAFFAAASALALPQMFWATRGSSVQSARFFGVEFGWEHGQENVVWFWLKNTGVFIPLLVAALAWRGAGRVVGPRLFYFYLPFTLCFVLPNVFKLSPWVWDNIKVLFYWWIASAPLVALVLARLWRQRNLALRLAAVALLFAQTAAGGLDVWRAASGAVERQTFTPDGVRFAELVRRETPPRALILHAPTYNDPVYLTGRRTFLGYPGHIWSHGLDYAAREAELKRIYSGAADAGRLLAANGIEYVVVGPLEEAEMRNYNSRLERSFFERYTKVGETGGYRLYKTTRP